MKNNNADRQLRTRSDFWGIGIAAFLALVVRAVYWIQTADNPFSDLLVLDSRVYHLLALEIANGDFWGKEVFFRAPLFPYLLGLTYKFFGIETIVIRLIHAALGVGTVILTYLIAEIHFDRTHARIAGIVAALYPTLYFFESTIMPTTVEVFTFTATVYFLSRFARSHRLQELVLAGFALGIGAAARPTLLSFLFVIPLWLALCGKLNNWRSWARSLAYLCIPLAIVILPITIRNYVIEPRLVLISSQGGANFYIGNNRQADGQTVSFPTGRGSLNPYDDHVWSASEQIAESETRRHLTAAEVSEYWFEKGVAEVWSNPVDGLKLTLRKFYLFLCGEEIFNNNDPLAQRDYAGLYSLFIWRQIINFPYGLLAPFFLIGTVMLLRARDKHWLLLLFVWSQVLTVALFFVSSRFRQPLLPVMIIIAIYGIRQLLIYLRNRTWTPVAVYGLCLVLLLMWLNPAQAVASRQNRSMYHAYLGGALAAKEKYPEAVEQLRQAIMIADDNATAFQLLGSLYIESGQYEQALAVLHRAEQLVPESAPTWSQLARIYHDLGRHDRALPYFEKVINTGTEIPGIPAWAAQSAYAVGDTSRCRLYLDLALKQNPADSAALRLRAAILR